MILFAGSYHQKIFLNVEVCAVLNIQDIFYLMLTTKFCVNALVTLRYEFITFHILILEITVIPKVQ